MQTSTDVMGASSPLQSQTCFSAHSKTLQGGWEVSEPCPRSYQALGSSGVVVILDWSHYPWDTLEWLVCPAQLKNPFTDKIGGSSWNLGPTVWMLTAFLKGFSRIKRCSNQYTALRLVVLLSKSMHLGKLSVHQAVQRWVLRDHNEGGRHQGDKHAARLQTDVSTQAWPINLIIIELTHRLC